MFGEITRVLLPRGFGFVRGEDGNDYFLHCDEWAGDWDGQGCRKGARVEFTPVSDDRAPGNGLRATAAKAAE
jgi:cold shock CspA family protein